MTITRVWIEDGCISCGMSEDNCPEVFKVKDEGSTVIEGVDYSGLEEKIKEAAKGCPVEVIKYDEDDGDQKNAPREIVKEQLSPDTKDSMGNPPGHSHKKTHVPDGGGKPFPNF